MKSHGLSKHKLYKVWDSMKDRCYRKKNTAYKRYGGSDVIVCDEWKNDFMAFYTWAIDKWKPGLCIDKDILCKKLNISPKIYSPQTCQFITSRENSMASLRVVIDDKLATDIEAYMASSHNLIGLRQMVADKFGITKGQLLRFLSSSRCKFKSERGATKKAYPELEHHIFKLKLERYTYVQIEAKTGVNWSTCRSIIAILKRQGYKYEYNK